MCTRPIRILFLAVLSIFISSQSHSGERLTLSGIGGSVNHEIGTVILTKAYAKIGMRIETVALPAKRSIVMANAGEYDGEVQRVDNVTQLYSNLVKVPQPILFLESSAFIKKPGIHIKAWDSLTPYLIGIPRGIMYLDRKTEGMKRVFVKDLDQLFQMLAIERIDVVIISTNYGRAFLKAHPGTDIEMIEPPILKTPLFHYLHRKHEGLVPRIAASIRQMQEDGTIDEIIATFAPPQP